jgi:hypothetical protein
MCAQRMLRAGPWSEVVRSGKAPKPDPRQQTLDLDAPSMNRSGGTQIPSRPRLRSLPESLRTSRVSSQTHWTTRTRPA